MRTIKKTFLSFMCFVAILTLYQTFDRWNKGSGLTGVEEASTLSAFTAPGFINSSFQREFEQLILRKIGIRKKMVMIDNQVFYSLFGEFSNPGIVVGKEDYLYELSYITDYNRENTLDKRDLRNFAGKIRRLQDALKARGKGLVYYIGPSKAETYPQYLPDEHVDKERLNREGNYERFSAYLKESGVNFIDGQAMMAEIADAGQYPAFNKSGIHWSPYGALVFAQSLVSKMESALGKRLVRLNNAGVEAHRQPRSTIDVDLANLSNLLFKSLLYDKVIYYPVIEVDDAGGTAYRPRAVWVGDSFNWQLLEYMGEYDVMPENVFYYYYNTRYEIRKGEKTEALAIERGVFDMTQDLKDADLVVIGFNTVNIMNEVSFVENALTTLENGSALASK